MLSSSVEPENGVATAAAAAVVPSRHGVDDERLVSSLRTQAEVDILCKKYGVPSVYTPRPAGDDRRACTPPPPGSVCVYAHALEAGMRVPLDGFFCEVLAHYAIAPAQIVPNGWRVVAGFLVLCRSVGVPPSLAVFRRFFVLCIVNSKFNGWYCFRTRDSSVLRFTGMPNTPMDWKKLFFFLSSPEPWPCPVDWGEPSKSSFLEPVLIGEEKKWEAKLLSAYGGGGAPVDINTCLRDGNLAGAMVTAASPPPPPNTTCSTSNSKVMDPSVYRAMKTMLAEKAAAKVTAEPGRKAPGSPTLCGKKRSLDQAKGGKGPCPPPSVPGVCSPPPGFSPKPRHLPSRHGGDTTDWEAARDLLQGAVSPQQEREFAASEPSDVVKSSHAVILQAVNCVTFSLSYALELEGKLASRDAEVAALREQLEEAKAELAAVKRAKKPSVELAAPKRPAKEAERESAEAAALQRLLGTEEHVRRRAEQALQRCERWRDDSSPHATASPTATSTPTTQEPMMHPSGRHKRRQEPSTKYDPKQWAL